MTTFFETPVRPAKKRRTIPNGVEISEMEHGGKMMIVSKKHVRAEKFAGYAGIEKLVLTESVKSIGFGAFHRMPDLRYIDAANATEVKLEPYCFSQLPMLETVNMPMVSVPPNCFFQCPLLLSVNFAGVCDSDTVLTIGEYALAHCGALRKVSGMPPYMLFGDFAFQDCTLLEGAFTVGGPFQKYVPGGIFYGCENITELEVLEETQLLGQKLCHGCTNLQLVHLPPSLMEINEEAFWGCESIKHITLGKNMRVIEQRAFQDCSALAEVAIRATARVEFLPLVFANCTALSSFAVPEKTTKLARGMFLGCSELQSVTLNKALLHIEKACFKNCTALHTCDFTVATKLEKLDMLCLKNTALTKVELHNTKILSIGEEAFSHMDNLTTLTLPESLEKIEKEMCKNCANLTAVHIPLKVKEIPPDCFAGCCGLETVHIAGDAVSIHRHVFLRCTSLRSATVGKENTLWDIIKYHS